MTRNATPYTTDELARLVARGANARLDRRRTVATLADYLALLDPGDAADRRSLALVDDAPDAFLPIELADRILAGDSPVKIWRLHRGLTQAAVADAADLSQSYLAEIESRRKDGSVEALRALARALNVDAGDLVG
ncbi:helix-turn-helix transcriptional regulator [Candidatus Uhrbacteria bacterium]|nr:helix-turn-helix transcriptional regulator [Candidatus Uhrbacteria bacterium]